MLDEYARIKSNFGIMYVELLPCPDKSNKNTPLSRVKLHRYAAMVLLRHRLHNRVNCRAHIGQSDRPLRWPPPKLCGKPLFLKPRPNSVLRTLVRRRRGIRVRIGTAIAHHGKSHCSFEKSKGDFVVGKNPRLRLLQETQTCLCDGVNGEEGSVAVSEETLYPERVCYQMRMLWGVVISSERRDMLYDTRCVEIDKVENVTAKSFGKVSGRICEACFDVEE